MNVLAIVILAVVIGGAVWLVADGIEQRTIGEQNLPIAQRNLERSLGSRAGAAEPYETPSQTGPMVVGGAVAFFVLIAGLGWILTQRDEPRGEQANVARRLRE